MFVQLLDAKNNTVGKITLHEVSKRPTRQYETHSYMDEEYRGRGWGTKIYARAIQWCLERGYRVKSSGYSSDMAARVWTGNGIREKFAIRKRRPPSHNNDYCTTWYAYPKPSDQLKTKRKMLQRKRKRTTSAKRR